MTLPMSVLDLSPVPSGGSSRQALADTVALAQEAERLGMTRFWVAEHHGMPGVASSAPAVLIGAIAAATSTIRVGSGGVMLPNHAPMVVAEQFGTLEALHPGRIDLGLGRAPGTDPATASALRRGASADDFPQELLALRSFFDGRWADGHPWAGLHAVPALGNGPALWLLGSSGYSAQVAGLLGLPFAFAHHFAPQGTLQALELYRSRFRPSEVLAEPYAMLCASVVLAEDDDRAHDLAVPSALSFLRLRTGTPGVLASVDEALAHPYSAAERAFVEDRIAQQAVGGPVTVRRHLDDLLAATEVDELMVTTMVHDPADRLASFRALAELQLAPV
ncbi:MAG: alkanal monooxygenase [Frankiales bacterium]|nr:alkanal monooxygenase [Frankiales bacterium]